MIVDASVAVKWLVREDDSDLAQALLGMEGLVAPDLIVSEIANAVWKKHVRGEISGIPALLGEFADLFEALESTEPLIVRATQIAVELNYPAYDCFYLALAEGSGLQIVTVDERLIKKLAGTDYASLAVTLPEAVVR